MKFIVVATAVYFGLWIKDISIGKHDVKFWLDSPDHLTEFPSISLESPGEYHSPTF